MTTQASDQLVERVEKAIKSAGHKSGCHHYDTPTDWSRPYCSCTAKAEAAIAAMSPTPLHEAAKGLAVALEKAIADATGKPNVWFFDAKDALTKWNEAQP